MGACLVKIRQKTEKSTASCFNSAGAPRRAFVNFKVGHAICRAGLGLLQPGSAADLAKPAMISLMSFQTACLPCKDACGQSTNLWLVIDVQSKVRSSTKLWAKSLDHILQELHFDIASRPELWIVDAICSLRLPFWRSSNFKNLTYHAESHKRMLSLASCSSAGGAAGMGTSGSRPF